MDLSRGVEVELHIQVEAFHTHFLPIDRVRHDHQEVEVHPYQVEEVVAYSTHRLERFYPCPEVEGVEQDLPKSCRIHQVAGVELT